MATLEVWRDDCVTVYERSDAGQGVDLTVVQESDIGSGYVVFGGEGLCVPTDQLVEAASRGIRCHGQAGRMDAGQAQRADDLGVPRYKAAEGRAAKATKGAGQNVNYSLRFE